MQSEVSSRPFSFGPSKRRNQSDESSSAKPTAIDSKTRMVAIGNVHWADGTLFDLVEIRKRTREVGALLIIEYQQTGSLAGQAMSLIAINLLISFTVPNISYGGHIGGLIGGILVTLALSRFGRGHVAYGRPGLVGIGGLVLVAVASIAVSYWRVRGYA